MEVIRPHAVILTPDFITNPNKGMEILQAIETAARTCYKSEEKNPDLKVAFLLTHVDPENETSRSVIENVREQFSHQVFKSVVPVDAAFNASRDNYETIFANNKNSQGAKACRLISEEILSELNHIE